jgi:c-di-GMP-binding flagellar brake protein YcgR
MSLLHFRRVERRRTARATMCMNLLVHGENAAGAKFRYWTKSLSVSAFGGVILLESPLSVGQQFHLANEHNGKTAHAKVVAIRSARDGQTHASFEFLEGAEKFWSMTFPPAGAKPLRRCGPKVAEAQ